VRRFVVVYGGRHLDPERTVWPFVTAESAEAVARNAMERGYVGTAYGTGAAGLFPDAVCVVEVTP
jgi:hypothetical protein